MLGAGQTTLTAADRVKPPGTVTANTSLAVPTVAPAAAVQVEVIFVSLTTVALVQVTPVTFGNVTAAPLLPVKPPPEIVSVTLFAVWFVTPAPFAIDGEPIGIALNTTCRAR